MNLYGLMGWVELPDGLRGLLGEFGPLSKLGFRPAPWP